MELAFGKKSLVNLEPTKQSCYTDIAVSIQHRDVCSDGIPLDLGAERTLEWGTTPYGTAVPTP